MKKTRILSLLLSAMMAVSSFPLMASASGAQALAEDVTPAFTTTASGAVTNVAAEDGYMSLTDRVDRYGSFQYAYNFKYGTRYKVTFDARMTVPSNGNYNFRVQTLTKGTPEFQSYSGGNPSGSYNWLSSDLVASRGDKTIVEIKAENPNAGGDNIAQGTLAANGNWSSFSFEYQFIDKPADATADTVLDRVSLFAGTNGVFTQSFDMDNFKLYEKQGTQWVELKSYDFETKPPMNGNVHDSFRAGASANVNPNGNTVLNWIPAADTAFSRVAGSASVPTSVEFTSDVTLEPGVYVASADLRFAFTVSAAAPNNDNTTVIEIANTLGGVETVAGTTEISNTWKTVTNTVVVYEATTFDGISFTSKGSTKTPANANKAIDYKNVSLALVQSLAPEVSDEENVTIIDLPEYDFTVDGGAALEPAGTMPASFEFGNKYIRFYGRNNNWAGINIDTSSLAFEDGKDYYISYDLRASQNVMSNALGDSLLTFHSGGRLNSIVFTATSNKSGNMINNIDNTKWITVEVPYKQTGATVDQIKNFNHIGQFSGTQMLAYDFDNFAVYYYNGDEKVYLYQEDFQDEATGELTEELGTYYKRWQSGRWVCNLQVAEDSLYYAANTASVNYTPAEETVLEPGVYTFTTEFAYGTHDHSKIKCNSASGGTYNGYDYVQHEVYENLNAYNVSANIALADGQSFVSQQVRAGDGWVSPTIVFSVFEPTALSSINYTLDAANDIMLKNAKLTCVAFGTVATEDETDYLANATVKPVNATVEDVSATALNGYLVVARRQSDLSNYVTIPLGEKAVAGRTYFVSMDMMRTEDGSLVVRPIVNTKTTETDGYLNGGYVFPVEGSELGSLVLVTKDGAHDAASSYARVDPQASWKNFTGKFTPIAGGADLQITINRGAGFYPTAFAIDNLKVWYMDGADEVVLVENDFDTEGDISGITALVPLTHEAPRDHTVLTPSASTASIIYDLALPEDMATEGTYTFKVDARTASSSAAPVNATITFKFDDGSVKTTETTIDGAWNTLAYLRAVDGATLESVTLTVEGNTAIQLSNMKLMFKENKDGGIPNIGIIMMLLRKREGDSGEGGKVIKNYEYIVDGKLDNAPIIHDKVAPKQQTVADAGFYTKLADAHPTKVTYVTEGGNSFVRVSDLDAGQRGIMYNTGIELQPGTYTFKVDLRVSEKEGEPNYTAYGWRTATKDSMNMRTILQNPNSVGSGNIATGVPFDKDTVMNPQGVVTSSQIVVTREWTTYTDTIVIEEPAVIIFKIGGGMSGNPDAHGYDIDNLSLKGLYVTPGTSEGGEDAPEQTDDVEGNLIVNGDFDEKPTVESGAYDEAKKNTWFENDGNGYELDESGKEIKDKPIFINHKIDWTDGYLTFSGRTNNLRQFYYNSGVTLEPGNYTMTLDFKTAKDGESCSVRVGVAGLFNPTTNDALAINNTWKTMTINFEVKEPTEVRLNFWGGPGAIFKKDFCVDNIVLVKN